jgi:hypothetical protein
VEGFAAGVGAASTALTPGRPIPREAASPAIRVWPSRRSTSRRGSPPARVRAWRYGQVDEIVTVVLPGFAGVVEPLPVKTMVLLHPGLIARETSIVTV